MWYGIYGQVIKMMISFCNNSNNDDNVTVKDIIIFDNTHGCLYIYIYIYI